jgi:hypothetical protein
VRCGDQRPRGRICRFVSKCIYMCVCKRVHYIYTAVQGWLIIDQRFVGLLVMISNTKQERIRQFDAHSFPHIECLKYVNTKPPAWKFLNIAKNNARGGYSCKRRCELARQSSSEHHTHKVPSISPFTVVSTSIFPTSLFIT